MRSVISDSIFSAIFHYDSNQITDMRPLFKIGDQEYNSRQLARYIYKNKKTVIKGNTRVELPLYYRPDFDAAFSATINYNDKLVGRVEFQVLGQMPYATTTAADGADSTLTLPMRYGLNLELEYRHNKALSFFLKADNLLFQRYFYWQNYPSYRALFLAGMTYTIPY